MTLIPASTVGRSGERLPILVVLYSPGWVLTKPRTTRHSGRPYLLDTTGFVASRIVFVRGCSEWNPRGKPVALLECVLSMGSSERETPRASRGIEDLPLQCAITLLLVFFQRR